MPIVNLSEDHDRLPIAGRDLRLKFLKCSDRAALRASERISMIELLSCGELRGGISNLDSSLQRGDALNNRGAMEWAGPLPSITQQRPLIARYAWPVDAVLAKPRDCIDDRILNLRRNETRSLS